MIRVEIETAPPKRIKSYFFETINKPLATLIKKTVKWEMKEKQQMT